ncbi:hypothetical protein ACLBWZ_09500 [Brucellaceae bacterium C25G]
MRDNDLPLENDGHKTGGALRLANAMRQAKVAAADRGDSIVDMKEAEIARLELLTTELQPVFDAVPETVELFDFTMSSGMQPRLWLDATAFVMLDTDRRTYKFVRDSRQGRIVLAQSADMKRVSESVTAYIADRLVEREQLLGDGVSKRPQLFVSELQTKASNGFLQALAWFMIGACVGAVLLFLIFQEHLMPVFHALIVR